MQHLPQYPQKACPECFAASPKRRSTHTLCCLACGYTGTPEQFTDITTEAEEFAGSEIEDTARGRVEVGDTGCHVQWRTNKTQMAFQLIGIPETSETYPSDNLRRDVRRAMIETAIAMIEANKEAQNG